MTSLSLSLSLACSIALAALSLSTQHLAATLHPETGVFDFDCARITSFPGESLAELVNRALARLGTEGVRRWGDRAVPLDLNRDSKPWYFVPLTCGATGNCYWGVFSTEPPKERGIIAGAIIHAAMRLDFPDDPVQLEAFSSLGAGEGLLATFEISAGEIREVSSARLTGEAVDRFLKDKKLPPCSTGPR